MQHVVPGEAERMDREEAIAALEDRLTPVRAGMEREHEAALLERAVDLHVGIVVDRHVGADRGHHEAADMFAAAEGLDLPQRLVRRVERQAQHRVEAPLRFRQNLFGEPPVVGPAQLDFHFLLRM